MLNKFVTLPAPKNKIYGTDQDDTLVSTSASDAIYGGDGRDTLISGAGADDLYGGKGDDEYVIKDSDDRAYESANEGNDTVNSLVNYTLNQDHGQD